MYETFFKACCFAFAQNMFSATTIDANEATISHAWFIFRMIATIGFVNIGEDLLTTLTNRIYLSTKYFGKKLGQTEFISWERHRLYKCMFKLLYEYLHVEVYFCIGLVTLYCRFVFGLRVKVVWCHQALKILSAVYSLRLGSWILSRIFDALWLSWIYHNSHIAHLEDLVWEYLVTIFASLKCLNAFALFCFAFAWNQIYFLKS